jgi:hypothetical protein
LLPFLKPKKLQTGVIVSQRAPDAKPEGEDSEEYHELEGCMQDFADALNREDFKGMARAIKDAFEVADSYPHFEGEHEDKAEPHSYDSQNKKAAE